MGHPLLTLSLITQLSDFTLRQDSGIIDIVNLQIEYILLFVVVGVSLCLVYYRLPLGPGN